MNSSAPIAIITGPLNNSGRPRRSTCGAQLRLELDLADLGAIPEQLRLLFVIR